MRIGDKIWCFNQNRRVYEKSGTRLGGRLIWIEHWEQREIKNETSRSWILGWGGEKINKKALEAGTLAHFKATFDEVKELEWAHVHKHRISKCVDRIKNIALLKQIAELIDYKEDKL